MDNGHYKRMTGLVSEVKESIPIEAAHVDGPNGSLEAAFAGPFEIGTEKNKRKKEM